MVLKPEEFPRGAELVDRVIKGMKEKGDAIPGGWPLGCPVPVAPDRLRRLSLPDGRPLPPGLRRWLTYDASLLNLFQDITSPILSKLSLSEMMSRFQPTAKKLSGHGGAELFAGFETLLPGDCIPLSCSVSGCRFIYAGEPDEYDEYPVFLAEEGEIPAVHLDSPGFDIYIAERMGVIKFVSSGYADKFAHRELKQAFSKQAKLNFNNFRWVELSGDAQLSDGRNVLWTDDPGEGFLEPIDI